MWHAQHSREETAQKSVIPLESIHISPSYAAISAIETTTRQKRYTVFAAPNTGYSTVDSTISQATSSSIVDSKMLPIEDLSFLLYKKIILDAFSR